MSYAVARPEEYISLITSSSYILRWLPTVLTVSTSKKRQTTKNEVFD